MGFIDITTSARILVALHPKHSCADALAESLHYLEEANLPFAAAWAKAAEMLLMPKLAANSNRISII